MDHSHHQQKEEHKERRNWWVTPTGIACMFFLAAGAYFLFTEHRAHVVPYLPWLLILACPLMHIFMHGGHGGHSKKEEE